MEEDEGEEYHFFGTPILEETEMRAGQHRKEVRDAAVTKALPLHQQEATDAQGRRRFHGAFTGGFSAGYFNTVGSKEGWAPSAFRSSRDARAQVSQSVEQYLDEDELEELRRTNLQTTADYDTFGSTAAELARRQAEEEAQARPSAIPGLLPDEVVAPVPAGAGIQLLQKMGWRQGKGIGGADADDAEEEAEAEGGAGSRRRRRWGRQAGVGPENTPLHLLAPKSDTFGLGYDPYSGAEEFRNARQQQQQQQQQAGSREGQRGGAAKRRRGVAFGTGVFDEDDAEGMVEDYVTHDDVESYEHEASGLSGLSMKRAPQLNKSGLGDRLARRGYNFEITEEGEEDEQRLLGWQPHRKQEPYALPGREAPLLLQSKEQQASRSLVPGFVRASASYQVPYYAPPQLPPGYVPRHRAVAAAVAAAGGPQAPGGPPPPQAPPPTDPDLKQAIDSLAFYVARNGPLFESVARERQQREGGHRFLLGGEGCAYYAWKLHSLRSIIGPQPHQQRQQQQQQQPRAIGQRSAPLSAAERGALLGETPLPGSGAGGAAAVPAFTVPGMPGQQPEVPGQQGQKNSLRRQLLQVAEADRQRLQHLLKRSFVPAQSQELLQPDAAASVVGLRPGAPQPPPKAAAGPATAEGAVPRAPPSASAPSRLITAADLSRPLAGPAAGPEASAAAPAAHRGLPVRRSEEWRPAPLLCKRFNVPDPYHGRPAELQMSKFKTDHLALPETAARVVGAVGAMAPGAEHFLLPPSVATAIQEAQQQQQQPVHPGPLPPRQPPLPGQLPPAAARPAQPPQPAQAVEQDAAGAADAFLSSLAGMLEAPKPVQPPAPAAAAAAAAAVEAAGLPPLPAEEPGAGAGMAEAEAAAAAERPIDLFKAIFEDSDEEEDEEEEEEEAEQQQQQQQAAPSHPSALPPGLPPARRAAAAQQAGPSDQPGFGLAKLRQQGLAEGAVAAPSALAVGPAAPALPPHQQQRQQAPEIDEALKERVQEALRNLKRHKKDKKEKKERRHGKKGKKKERKERKGSREKEQRHRKSSRRSAESSGSGSEASSDSDA